ncbi:MAG TPA: hypothetical protein PKE26_12435 [Kiritimatiellia bacterium]|nr:hypothetical protein [Kiritimatiellia bacterium]HMO99908.1 hypothetical protein [Kiritimatiellia bacterium]HMP96049.1 hypothetical protein [Kiritimatiellia bacterium]
MNRYLILAQSEVTARALGAWLELLGEASLEEPVKDSRVLRCRELGWGSDLIHAYRAIVSKLDENLIDGSTCDCVTVLVDHVDWNDLNATASPQGWSRLVSLLILTFPDVRWVFGTVSRSADSKSGVDFKSSLFGLQSLLNEHHDPTFDGTGLRAHVRSNSALTKNNDGDFVAPWIPQRKEWCCAIDDEQMYAYLHGYVAFRNGFRVFPVFSQTLADQLLKPSNGTIQWGMTPPALTLEDYYLGFPDKDPNVGLSNLEKRNGHWKLLDDPSGPFRCFITSGHGRSQEPGDREDNRNVREDLRSADRGGREASKPIAGIFSLWKELWLDRHSFDKKTKRGHAPGYHWPPPKNAIGGEGSGHSAPGLLLMVAENLIHRAEQRVDKVITVRDAVKGAVLALSAQELLGPKTPTTAREALELKHRFEALAECQFGGVQYNLDLTDRFAEISRDMKQLGYWYGIRARGSAVLNGELAIVSCLLTIYKDNEEFDEEETCRKRIRDLQRKIWWRQKKHNPLTWFVLPIRYYIDLLLGSLTRLFAAIVVWISGLTLGFKLLKLNIDEQNKTETAAYVSNLVNKVSSEYPYGIVEAISDINKGEVQVFGQAISSFFGTEPMASSNTGWMVLSVLAVASGFIHLGIFISQLYSIASRR